MLGVVLLAWGTGSEFSAAGTVFIIDDIGLAVEVFHFIKLKEKSYLLFKSFHLGSFLIIVIVFLGGGVCVLLLLIASEKAEALHL